LILPLIAALLFACTDSSGPGPQLDSDADEGLPDEGGPEDAVVGDPRPDGNGDADTGLDNPADPDLPEDAASEDVEPEDVPADGAQRCVQPVDIDNSGNPSTLSEFQVMVEVPHSANMKSDFSDLRFGNEDLSEPLPYWIEDTGGGDRASVWVRVPSIMPSAVTRIFMHYGDPTAADEGDPEAVFDFYDDFEGGTMGKWTALNYPDHWAVSTAASRSGTHALSVTNITNTTANPNPDWGYIVAAAMDFSDIAFDAWWMFSGAIPDVSQTVRSASAFPMSEYEFYMEHDGQCTLGKVLDDYWTSFVPYVSFPAATGWVKVTVMIIGNEARAVIDDSTAVPGEGWGYAGDEMERGTAGFRVFYISPSSRWSIDDVRVRKAADPFPGATVGDEQCM
jgi:hypothetical protein